MTITTTTRTVTLTTLENAEDAEEFLLSAGVQGPSLHPRVNSENHRDRWNGWNHAQANGVDAEGMPVFIESWHFATGWMDISGRRNGGTGRLGRKIAFDGFVWPIQMFPPVAVILHPEHTPEVK